MLAKVANWAALTDDSNYQSWQIGNWPIWEEIKLNKYNFLNVYMS